MTRWIDAWRPSTNPLMAMLNAAAAGKAGAGFISFGWRSVFGLSVAITLQIFLCAVSPGVLWMVLPILVAVVAAASGPGLTLVEAKAAVQSGALQRHRLAGASPRAIFAAYLLGPQLDAVVGIGVAVCVGALGACLRGDAAQGLTVVLLCALCGVLQLGASLIALRYALEWEPGAAARGRFGDGVASVCLWLVGVSWAILQTLPRGRPRVTPVSLYATSAAVLALLGLGLARDWSLARRAVARVGPLPAEPRAMTLDALRRAAIVALLLHPLSWGNGEPGGAVVALLAAVSALAALLVYRDVSPGTRLAREARGEPLDPRATFGRAMLIALAGVSATAWSLDHPGGKTAHLAALLTTTLATVAAFASVMVGGWRSPLRSPLSVGIGLLFSVFALFIVEAVSPGVPTVAWGLSLNPFAAFFGTGPTAWAPYAQAAVALALGAWSIARVMRLPRAVSAFVVSATDASAFRGSPAAPCSASSQT